MLPQLFLAGRILQAGLRNKPRPFKLTYALTYRCNSRCQSCGIWRRDPGVEMSAVEIKEFFRRYPYWSWIDVTGGEIFLRSDLLAILKGMVKQCRYLYMLHFPTNGSLPEEVYNVSRRLLDTSLPRLIVSVSLDGPPELHETLRGIPGGWEKSIATYRRLAALKSRRFSVFFGLTLQAANYRRLWETLAAVKKVLPQVSIHDFHVNYPHRSAHYYGNDSFAPGEMPGVAAVVEEFQRARRRPLDPVSWLEATYLKNLLRYIAGTSGLPRCRAVRASLFLAPDGAVFPCSSFSRPLGRLADYDFNLKKILGLPTSGRLQAEIAANACGGCWTPCDAYPTILVDKISW